jgi:hypothetical protein
LQARDQRDEEIVVYLEPDQLVADQKRPVPRARLGRWARAGLWSLRVLVAVMGMLVIYTFIAQLGH